MPCVQYYVQYSTLLQSDHYPLAILHPLSPIQQLKQFPSRQNPWIVTNGNFCEQQGNHCIHMAELHIMYINIIYHCVITCWNQSSKSTCLALHLRMHVIAIIMIMQLGALAMGHIMMTTFTYIYGATEQESKTLIFIFEQNFGFQTTQIMIF